MTPSAYFYNDVISTGRVAFPLRLSSSGYSNSVPLPPSSISLSYSAFLRAKFPLAEPPNSEHAAFRQEYWLRLAANHLAAQAPN